MQIVQLAKPFEFQTSARPPNKGLYVKQQPANPHFPQQRVLRIHSQPKQWSITAPQIHYSNVTLLLDHTEQTVSNVPDTVSRVRHHYDQHLPPTKVQQL